MTDYFNLTAINESENYLRFALAVNDATNGILGAGWALVIILLIFVASYLHTRSFGKSLVSAGALSLLPFAMLMFWGLIGWYLIILSLTCIGIGYVLLQPKDTST